MASRDTLNAASTAASSFSRIMVSSRAAGGVACEGVEAGDPLGISNDILEAEPNWAALASEAGEELALERWMEALACFQDSE